MELANFRGSVCQAVESNGLEEGIARPGKAMGYALTCSAWWICQTTVFCARIQVLVAIVVIQVQYSVSRLPYQTDKRIARHISA